ncbi:hypothetical protein I3843_06G052900 [Carya illinoinensis]|nr:hypothetical protein I3843_06G052900 [Carya illinoinensis]
MVILAEYTEFSGKFSSIASQCLQKLPASNNRFTYNCNNRTFNYLIDNSFSISPFLSLISIPFPPIYYAFISLFHFSVVSFMCKQIYIYIFFI